MNFTTRPEITGTFGVVTSTHWIASSVGMSVLEQGGNAFDAACASGFVLNVVEPHLNGLGGDLVAIGCRAGDDAPRVLCGQGVAPAGATIDHYRGEGLELVPGTGLLATVVPGAFDGWMLLLREWGTMSVREILQPAIHYAESGHPMLPRACKTIAEMTEFFKAEWPTSAQTWLIGGSPPKPWQRFRNPELAELWKSIVRAAEAKTGRECQIEAARAFFYRGMVAERIDAFFSHAELKDGSGDPRRGVMRADDLARWSATFESALSQDYGDWTVFKGGPWTQGPLMLEALAILAHMDVAELGGLSPEFVHIVTETLKLAFADRDAYFGDADSARTAVQTLLSEDYGAQRARELDSNASLAYRPGPVRGQENLAAAASARSVRPVEGKRTVGAGEPTMIHLADSRGDTVHVDIIDRWGNMIAATPSGGWLQSSPIVPGLGIAMNTRAQMFWLEEGLPTSLAPGRRPRTTLTPTLASHRGKPAMVFGTPGGDQQEQWQLIFFLRLLHEGFNMQEAIDAPQFHTRHLQSSFHPREIKLGDLMLEPAFGQHIVKELQNRGHDVEVSAPWAVGRLTAAARQSNGILRAAATPRLMQAYAVGR